jgi:hypothetical protein
MAITIFIFDIKKNPKYLQLARNALKRAKTIRYPDCIRYIDGVEVESTNTDGNSNNNRNRASGTFGKCTRKREA